MALLVCLIPTTIGGLLSAIGIAGMDRLVRLNVIAKSGRAVEAAGDVHELDEADDGWPWDGQPLTSHVFRPVGLDDLGLALNDQPQRPADGHHGQRLE